MRERGLSPAQSAVLLGFALFSTALSRPAFGFVADKFQKHKIVLIVCMLASSVCYGSLWLIPSLGTKDGTVAVYTEELDLICHEGNAFVKLCEKDFCDLRNGQSQSGNVSFHCRLECERDNIADHTLQQLSQNMSISCPISNISSSANLSSVSLEVKVDIFTQRFGSARHTVTTCGRIESSNMRDTNDTAQDTLCNQARLFKCNTSCLLVPEHTNSLHHVSIYNPLFYAFVIIFLFANTFQSTIVNLVDAMTYNILGSKRTSWGVQRVWGTIGFALFGGSAGYLMDVATNEGQVDRYLCCFVLFICLLCGGVLSVCFYKISGDIKCSHPAQKLWQFLGNFEVMSLFVIVFVLGAFIGVVQTFRLWHLQNLGASQLLLGLCVAASCIPEIPLLFAMGHIITFAGEQVCLYVACVAYGCRFLGYSFLTNPWFALLVEPIHCMSYTLAYGAASVYGSRLTPDGMHGTMQAILITLLLGFGEAIVLCNGACHPDGHYRDYYPNLMLCRFVNLPRLIWGSNTHRINVHISDFQMSCRDLTAWQDTGTVNPTMAAWRYVPVMQSISSITLSIAPKNVKIYHTS